MEITITITLEVNDDGSQRTRSTTKIKGLRDGDKLEVRSSAEATINRKIVEIDGNDDQAPSGTVAQPAFPALGQARLR